MILLKQQFFCFYFFIISRPQADIELFLINLLENRLSELAGHFQLAYKDVKRCIIVCKVRWSICLLVPISLQKLVTSQLLQEKEKEEEIS
jgi:hypothetical protein